MLLIFKAATDLVTLQDRNNGIITIPSVCMSRQSTVLLFFFEEKQQKQRSFVKKLNITDNIGLLKKKADCHLY